MWKDHPNLEAPATNVTVWRYMDFTKFVDLLETKTLYFARADKFDDPFEGSYPKFNVQHRKTVYEDIPPEIQENVFDRLSAGTEGFRRCVAMNCWHINEQESAAMWKLYLKSNEGIAIKSTYEALIDSLGGFEEDVFIGTVKYIDYSSEWMPEGNLFYPYVHKRKSFEYEQELRALICRFPVKDGKMDYTIDVIDHGIAVPIDVPRLLQCVYIAPDAPIWFKTLVESVVRRYGLDARVEQSILAEGPVY